MPLFYKQVFAFFNTYKEKQCNPTTCTVSLLKKTICSNMRVLHKGKSIFLSIILFLSSRIEKNSAFLCKGCSQVENTRHVIFECENVHILWKNISYFICFDVQWKHLIFGFYSVQNNTTFFV